MIVLTNFVIWDTSLIQVNLISQVRAVLRFYTKRQRAATVSLYRPAGMLTCINVAVDSYRYEV